MKDLGFIRTALFVPGNRPDRVDKAVNSEADAVIIDLEDAVPLVQKKNARCITREKLTQHQNKTIFVRVNALGSEFAQEDLDDVVIEGLSGIIVPKVETCFHIQEINQLLSRAEKKNRVSPGTVPIIPLIESAKAVQNVFEIASERTEPLRTFTVAFGAADYGLDLGIQITREGTELLYARSKIPLACRAAGIGPPLDTPFMIDIKDQEALRKDAQRARQLGFQGKLCIHPSQIECCNTIFSPTEDEISFANRVIEAFENAEAEGVGAIQVDGKFIDYAVVAHARRIKKRASFLEGT